jgi:YhgE/Pip-like protein
VPAVSADDQGRARARQLLRVPAIWVAPLVLTTVLVALISVIYIGSVVNPAGHLHGMPVMIVNSDRGATVDGKRFNVGESVTNALQRTPAVSDRLKLRVVSQAEANATMDKAGAYATLVLPATLTRSVLQIAGVKTPGSTPAAEASVTIEQNLRLGSLGVSLATGVLTPAIEKISPKVGSDVTPVASRESKQNPVVARQLADPLTLATASYRPLPDHTALGLSAFYIALLSLMAGFLGATLINASVDSALGYATTEIGPRFAQRRPVAIDRRQTFLTKWAIAAVATPMLTGILLLIAGPLLGMHAPSWLLLWALLALTAFMVATGTLALFAAFGTIGQLLAMILLLYLGLASSGGTVPTQALPGIFAVVAHVEPLRQTLVGTRAILYFNARGDAGLTHSLIVIAFEFLFWAIVGVGVTIWYDHRKLDRISPDLLSFIQRAADQRRDTDPSS